MSGTHPIKPAPTKVKENAGKMMVPEQKNASRKVALEPDRKTAPKPRAAKAKPVVKEANPKQSPFSFNKAARKPAAKEGTAQKAALRPFLSSIQNIAPKKAPAKKMTADKTVEKEAIRRMASKKAVARLGAATVRGGFSILSPLGLI